MNHQSQGCQPLRVKVMQNTSITLNSHDVTGIVYAICKSVNNNVRKKL